MQKRREAFRSLFRQPRFTRLVLSGFEENQSSYVRKFLSIPESGLELDGLRERYFHLVSEGYFERIIPSFRQISADGEYELELKASPEDVLSIDAGGLMATQTTSFLYLGLNYKRLDRILSTYHVSVQAGAFYKSAHVNSRLFFPSRPQLYIEPHFTFNSWNFLESEDLLPPNISPTFIEQSDRKLGIDIGIATTTRSKLVFHASYLNNSDRYANTEVVESSDRLDELDFEAFRTGLRFESGSLNERQYPTSGKIFRAEGDFFSGNEHHQPGTTSLLASNQAKSRNWLQARLLYRHLLPLGRAAFGYSIQATLSTQQAFRNYMGTLLYAPAAFPLPESRTIFLPAFRAYNFAMGGLELSYPLSPRLAFRNEVYGFVPFWKIEQSQPQIAGTDNAIMDISIAASSGFVYKSPIGPISVRASYYDDDRHRFFLLAHVGYMLYRKRSTE